MKRVKKILHIGNIANNAYLNAKILNSETNIESDVLLLDYYHIMGCPEWEDADFMGDYGDDNSPDWSDVNLSGFKRPSWFVQGHREYALKYLLAKNEGKLFKSKLYKYLLKKSSESRKKNKATNSIFTNYYYLFSALKFVLFVMCNKDFCDFKKYFKEFSKIKLFILFVFLLPLTPILVLCRIYAKNIKHEYFIEFENRISELYESFKEIQPARACYFDKSYFTLYQKEIILWKKLLSYYDMVIGYGLDGIYPLLCGKKYIAFEHGTIRNLPFQNTTLGVITAITYIYANHVIITNADNLLAANKLKLEKYTFVPHPINEDPLIKIANKYENLHSKYDTDFIIFHPSRQHWEKDVRHPDWEKGNDIFIDGFAKFVKEINKSAKAILISWGHKTEDSKLLIELLGIQDNIIWLKPKSTYEMTRTILGCDLLADQFYLGAFGSTAPRAWLCSKPSMLYLNENMHEWCFNEMPMNIQASTPKEVFDGLRDVYSDVMSNKKEFNDLSKKWYERYHSNDVIREKLLKIIDSV